MFPMTVTLHNLDQLTRVTAALYPTIQAGASSTACDDQLAPEPQQEVAAAPAGKSKAKPTASSATPAPSPRTAEVAVAAAPVSTDAESSPAAPSVETAAPASTAATDVAYTDLQRAILKLHAKDPQATQAIAAEMGLPNFKPLKEDATGERRVQALALIEAKLAALGA